MCFFISVLCFFKCLSKSHTSLSSDKSWFKDSSESVVGVIEDELVVSELLLLASEEEEKVTGKREEGEEKVDKPAVLESVGVREEEAVVA